MKVATYLRVSTGQQTVENQRMELSRYIEARGWTLVREYADEGVSGALSRRPALDQLLADARRRRFSCVCVAKLDRFGRSLKDLVLALEELHSLGITFVSVGEGFDFSSSSGRLQFHILSALANGNVSASPIASAAEWLAPRHRASGSGALSASCPTQCSLPFGA